MPLVPVLLQAFSAIVATFNFLAAVFVQYADHPSERYSDKVEKLQKDRWSEVSTELGDILSQVEQLAGNTSESNGSSNSPRGEDAPGTSEEPGSKDGEDVTPEAGYSLIIQQELNRDELNGLGDKLKDVDAPREQLTKCRETRDGAMTRFVVGLFGAIVAVALAFVSVPLGGGIAVFVVVIILSTLSTWAAVSALNQARHWRNARQRLDQMWEDYNYM